MTKIMHAEVVQHLDQIAALLDQITTVYVDNQRMNWDHIETLEQQVAAHLHALRTHWDTTRAVAAQYLERYDSLRYTGAIYALACGGPDQSGVDIVIDTLTRVPDPVLLSYSNILQRATHPALPAALCGLMTHPKPLVRLCIMELLGFRREGDPAQIARRITQDADERVRDAAILTCARLGYRDIVPLVERRADTGESQRPEVLLATLCLGSDVALHSCRIVIGKYIEHASAELLSWLAMSGDARDLELLLVAFTRNKGNAYPALAMLGDINSIPYLLDDLKHKSEPIQKLAHYTLRHITGATVNVPNYSLWRGWWRRNTARFSEHPRWRRGRPWSLLDCIDTLAAPGLPYLLRHNAYLELTIRSGHTIHFEPGWEIPRQREAIKQWRAWWDQEQHRFIDKPWPYAGR